MSAAEQGLAPDHLMRWQEQLRRSADGEVITHDQVVMPPPIVPGVILRSGTTRYVDSDLGVGVGGMVVCPGKVDGSWLVVEVRRSQIHYHTILDEDVDWSLYHGMPNLVVLRDLRVALNADRTRRGHGGDHMPALAVIESCLS